MEDKPVKRPVGRPRGKVVKYYEVFNVHDIERESLLRGDRERLLEAMNKRSCLENIVIPLKTNKPVKKPRKTSNKPGANI